MQNGEGSTMSSTPSPSAPPSTAGSTNGSASRRPPRKSTLTQQQKNQKRQRATQDQLITLEVEFNKNPTPTAVVRERIAQEINMTERSVQIWFQNRRAKIKTIAKRSIETGEDCDNIPESMRRYLAIQAMEMGKGLGSTYLGRNGATYTGYGNGSMLLPENSNGKVVIQHFNCRSLSIGSWRRIGQAAMDLVIFYSPDRATVTYYINNDSAGYKIEYPFSYIKNITLESGDVLANAEGAAQRPGGLVVELNRPPLFYMDSSGSGGFYQCGDFTEEQQASQILTHHLGGHPKVLSGQLAKLVSLESFQNRHFQDPNQFPVSAPVSPVGNFRPASQPNQMGPPSLHFSHDNHPMAMGMPPRGHKRQRSRSVPVAIDFSMLRGPMPSFLIQPEHQHTPAPMPDPNIYAPTPQHHNGFGPGPNLSIDTSASYGMELRHQYGPMSATTANSPSEFGTPAFFNNSTAPSDTLSTFANSQTPYSLPYLSPMVDPSQVAPPSVSPLSAVSPHADPVIANQSPPLGSLDHGDPTHDIYGMHNEQGSSEDASLSIGDMYAKSSMTLPFRGPLEENQNQHQENHHMNMQNLVPFGTIDPQSLSPGLSPGHSNM